MGRGYHLYLILDLYSRKIAGWEVHDNDDSTHATRDDTLMDGIRAAWEGFQVYLDGDTPPPLSEADTVVRSDVVWSAAAAAYSAAKRAAEEHAERLDAAKAALVALTAHPRESGSGVSVTRFWKNGNVDYKKVPALQGLDLTLYRGKSREEVRITESPAQLHVCSTKN